MPPGAIAGAPAHRLVNTGRTLLNIFLTGAAGLIGGEVAGRLVAEGHEVTALVHRNRDIRANDGAPVAVTRTIAGDVSRERMGWSETTHAAVAATVNLVIHCAATVRFDAPEAELHATNVGGARAAIGLARRADAPLLHVSTAYVCGERDGPVAEGPVPTGTVFANGYERSKAQAEALVEGSGIDWVLARPSIVVGDSATGTIRQFDTIYAAFRLVAQGHVRRLPALWDATLDFVPIDHVAGGLVDLAGTMAEARGQHVHLTAAAPVPVQEFVAAIARRPHFSVPELVAPDAFDPATLPPRERRLHGLIADLYATYFQRDPRFIAERLAQLSGRRCPPTDAAFLDRLIEAAIRAGFLPAPNGAP